LQGNLKYWVAINSVTSESLRSQRLLARHFGEIRDVFRSRKKDLVDIGLDEDKAEALLAPGLLQKAEKEISWLESKGFFILTVKDREYPEYLREIFDPPLVLYGAGSKKILGQASVSIVGARKPSPYGRAIAERLSQDLASRGLVVVSGLARGIDSMSHWGALKEGRTVAVLGSGLDVLYPRENRDLFQKILEKGAVITEYPRKSPPLGFHFPLRNRIISGLSRALIVIEATKRSGSLISARLALEQNREVMAVPGNITSSLSQGTNWLIKGGAKLVEDWKDVAEELSSPLREQILSQTEKPGEKALPLSPEEKRVYNLLVPDALKSVDELVEESRLSVSEVLSLLLSLELKDLVTQRPGKFYQRKM
jgi:DNA processing protein